MTIVLHDYIQLEELSARHLRKWKLWHIFIYIIAAIFSILNYTFLVQTMELVDDNCILYPRHLVFHMVEISNEANKTDMTDRLYDTPVTVRNLTVPLELGNAKIFDPSASANETVEDVTDNNIDSDVIENKGKENVKKHLMLDTSKTFFGVPSDCEFAQYTPIMSAICGVVWATLFTMCPGGGRSRSGLQQPWRILTPALVFSLIMAGVMGASFCKTNGGLQDFCSSFSNITNSTKCSSLEPLLERGWNVSWSLAGREASTRAWSAAAWTSWGCAVIMLVARYLIAPDFTVKRTGVYLEKDPLQKVTPYLQKSPRHGKQSTITPSGRDNTSLKSDPTFATELVTASVEIDYDSSSSSLTASPIKNSKKSDTIDVRKAPEVLLIQR